MAELDDVIHQPLRLRIMAALNALPTGSGLEFARLKKLTGATDGNLGAHIETLTRAGYVAVEKAFVGKKPQTTVTATAAGRGAFARHVATLQEIIAGGGAEPGSPKAPSFRGARETREPGIWSLWALVPNKLGIPDRRARRAVRNDGVNGPIPLARGGGVVRTARLS